MSAEISQADLLREWIEKKIEEKYNYSKASYKKNDRIKFCEAHPELNTTPEKIRKHHDKILKEVGPKQGKTPSELGIKTPKVNPGIINSASDMDSTITPAPQPEITQPGVPGQPPTPGQPGVPYVNPNMTVESIGALCQGGMAGIKSILPDLELLNDEEKKSIGAILLPPLSRISDERIQLYLFPFLGILGIVGPKIAKARNIKKEKNIKKKKEKQDKEIQEADTKGKDSKNE